MITHGWNFIITSITSACLLIHREEGSLKNHYFGFFMLRNRVQCGTRSTQANLIAMLMLPCPPCPQKMSQRCVNSVRSHFHPPDYDSII
jgi:hypothetical protein